jgi:peptidoglycan-N-acetylglucosamine deacetylase
MAGDFVPYYPRIGDSWGPDEPYKFGRIVDLVELPINWALDDFVAFETYLGLIPGYVEPRALERMWRDDFDFALEECGDGVFIPTMHPQCIGRGSRIRMLERLIEHMQGNANVEFKTMRDYATAWAAKNPVDTWQEENSTRCGKGAITSL